MLAGHTVDGGRLQIRAVVVERFGAPAAALVVRARTDDRDRTSAFLRECAAVLAPLLERRALLARSAQRDQELHAASERRLRRLGFDLHDGPLQDLAALGADLQLARGRSRACSKMPLPHVVLGRFDDLAARLLRDRRDAARAVAFARVVERRRPLAAGDPRS